MPPTLVVGRNDLASVAPVHFVSVVLLLVVGSCDHDPSCTPQLKRRCCHEGGGDYLAEQVHFDALADADGRSYQGESARPGDACFRGAGATACSCTGDSGKHKQGFTKASPQPRRNTLCG